MAQWWNFFRLFNYAFTDDPLSKRDRQEGEGGAGYTQPEAMPDLRANSDGMGGGGSVRLRDTNDFVDLSTVTNRIHRYKEYDRLRGMAEIDMAMTVFADEACLAGETLVATPSMDGGFTTIQKLAETMADERFLCYCWDFENQDYTLGWAYAPRLVKEEETVRIVLDDGNSFIVTKDHRILMRNQKWINAEKLQFGDELMPFYHLPARPDLTGLRVQQWPRIFTHSKGWIHERQFIDEWKGKTSSEQLLEANKLCQMVAADLSVRKISELTGHEPKINQARMERFGFSNKEMKWLGKKPDRRKVVGVFPHKTIKVYDMTVEKHHNFATNWGIVHNCQRDEDGKVFEISIKNQEIKDELNFLWFNRKMLNWDQKKAWNRFKNLCIHGDDFWEVVINTENPKEGVAKLEPLPPDSMYRIETTKGRLVEFQQSKEGPDYNALERVDIANATEADLMQSKAIRFAPQQIVHVRIGDDRKDFYPYGVSLMEAARGPAHQLRLMEDAMMVYRLTRAPERRVFYIDVAQLTGARAEAFVERMKDQYKKKKTSSPRGGGASSVEERWHAPAADEDFWVPTRPNSNTRVETLPGAQNLGEIDDTVYFRNKLFVALNFPKNYFNNEDPQTSRIALSAQDIKFARMIERLQSHMEDAIWEVCDRHLKLRGFPEEMYEDLEIHMTPPSDWRELTRAEVITSRITNAGSLKGAQLMSDYDILVHFMHYTDEEVKKMLARLKIQKLEELKLQIIAQNPDLLGIGNPGTDEQQIGAEAGQDPSMPGGQPPPPPPGGDDGMGGAPVPPPAPPAGGPAPTGNAIVALPEPEEEDIRKYNLDIKDFGSEQDEEEIDNGEF